ncbi:cupin domain-containing protein [Roseomonas elaeocarpi]|uniref:Cupin domain-containing protein n=1 Tax=Roseomonas elaeocarpi TaxID=907779 RepID=A0ABV6JRQ1_9PROT
MRMRMLAASLLFIGAGTALAQDWTPPTVVPADARHWNRINDLVVAQVAGDRNAAGSLYASHVTYPKGVRNLPHTHPDARIVTVLSGTFYQGFGGTFDEAKLQALPPGSVVVIPAGTPHYGIARDGDVTLQEVGIGPTATTPWAAAAR